MIFISKLVLFEFVVVVLFQRIWTKVQNLETSLPVECGKNGKLVLLYFKDIIVEAGEKEKFSAQIGNNVPTLGFVRWTTGRKFNLKTFHYNFVVSTLIGRRGTSILDFLPPMFQIVSIFLKSKLSDVSIKF